MPSLPLPSQGVATSYTGNYRSFLEQKDARNALQMRDWELQQKDIKALKAEINKLRPLGESAAGCATCRYPSLPVAHSMALIVTRPPHALPASRVHSHATPASRMHSHSIPPRVYSAIRNKERDLADLEPGGSQHISKPFVDKKKFSFRFPPSPRCSQEVIELEGVSHGYGDSTLFSDIDLCIERGDRIAILGPNGAGPFPPRPTATAHLSCPPHLSPIPPPICPS